MDGFNTRLVSKTAEGFLSRRTANSIARFAESRRYIGVLGGLGVMSMLMEKKALSIMELEAQSAMELPNREMMLVTVVITNVLNNLSIDVDVKNNNVAVQICAVVTALSCLVSTPLSCEIQQAQ